MDRRGFLKLLGLSGAGLGIGVLSSSPAAAATKITSSEVVTDQTRLDSLILNSLTADPGAVEQGQVFYRSDVDEIRYSPDGTATKQVGSSGADWSEVTNKPVLPEGVSSAVILRMQLSDAEQRFAATLAQRNYDDMFVDPYVDQSRIASTSGDVFVADGQDGNAFLGGEATVSRGDDDGSLGRSFEAGLVFEPDIKITEFSGSVSSNTSGATTAYLRQNSDGTLIEQTSISSGSFSFTGLSLSSGTEYRITVDAGGSDYTVGQNGSPSFPYSSDVFDITTAFFGGTTQSAGAHAVNDLTAKGVGGLSGTVTSVSKDLGYSPDKMQVIDDATVPANTDLSYTLRDENGNTVDVPRSALESDVDTSALTGTTIELVSNFSSDGSDTPTQEEVGWISV